MIYTNHYNSILQILTLTHSETLYITFFTLQQDYYPWTIH